MKKKTVTSVMVVAMLFAVSLYFIGGTYARYVDTFTGEGTVQIAKWAVKLGADSGSGSAMTLNLKAADAEGYVVAGKIAPSYKATGDVEIELNETEVAVDVIADIDKEEIASTLNSLGFTENAADIQVKATATAEGADVSVEANGEGTQEKPFVIKLPNNVAFKEDAKLKVSIEVNWDNADDQHNTEHTAVGKNGGSLSIPVDLHVVQHIESDPYEIPGA